MAGRGCLPVEKQSPTALVRMNELELTQSECSTSEQIVERNQKANPYSEYEKEKGSLLQETTNSQGSTTISIGRTLNTFTQFEERKYEHVLNKGDLIEFSPYHYHSFTILNPPSYHDDEESIVHKDVKAHSHCAVYIGSGTIEGPNTPYCVKEFTDIPLTDPTKRTIKVVYTTNKQDNIKSIVRVGEPIQVAKVENAEPYQSNPMNEMSNSTKSSIERTVNTCTQFDERKYEQVLNKGDLFEFHPCHSFMSRYPPHSHPDDEESIVHKDVDSKAHSHWAVYLGSGTIEGPNTPYCIKEFTDIPLTDPTKREMQDTKLTKITLIVSYPTEEQNKNIDLNLKDSDELKTIVRIGDLLQIAKVQKAKPCQNIQMDKICKLKGKEQSKHIDSTIKMLVTTDDPQVQIAEPYQNNEMNEISELKPVYSTKEKDKDTDIKLTDSDELKMIVTTDDPEVQIAEPYQNNPMDEMLNSTKTSVGRTVNTCTELDETTNEEKFKEGDLIQFRPYHSCTIRYPPYSHPDNTENIVREEVRGKVKSHWAVYLGSGKVAHVAGPNTPYCVKVLREIQTANQRMCLIKAVYPTTVQANIDLDLKDSDDLKPIVRIDELLQVAKVQKAEPCKNNKMDKKYIAGTPTEIVNIAKHLVGISLPHDFITKDCKDFAFFCRYGENLRSLKETQQHEHSTNKIMCMGILGVAIAIVALKMSKLL